jgi:hypothetical protein
MGRKTEEDRIIAENENKIRELVAVNDALRTLRDAKKRIRTKKASE